MPPTPQSFQYEAMGTHWKISLWDDVAPSVFEELRRTIVERTQAFDVAFSRFKPASLIRSLAGRLGRFPVPPDLVTMLRLYQRLGDLSGGKCNPCVGFALNDLGYDDRYTLRPQPTVRPVPTFRDAIRIIDDGEIELLQPVLIDLGALGKCFFVGKLASLLTEQRMERFLVDGSGDVEYRGHGETIRVGLEHPGDTTKVIGVVEMLGGAMCSSAGNRRRWGACHHTIDPHTRRSPEYVIATWVMAADAAVADGLATCLFFVDPEIFRREFTFEYCILNREYKVKRSEGFVAELY